MVSDCDTVGIGVGAAPEPMAVIEII